MTDQFNSPGELPDVGRNAIPPEAGNSEFLESLSSHNIRPEAQYRPLQENQYLV